ncbi:hypothetical protein D3C86_1500890 [compost metagenome]
MGLQGLEATMVFQRLATCLTKAGEVRLQGMLAHAKAVIQRTQQELLGLGGSGPFDQGQLLQAMQFGGEPGVIDGDAHGTFTEDHARGGVQAIEEQPAGG